MFFNIYACLSLSLYYFNNKFSNVIELYKGAKSVLFTLSFLFLKLSSDTRQNIMKI